ncbi:MAG: GNAT family N-acetyltransferase [Melioribacteraceae bacterium]|nr:GNAT family N-acetyltransferase [Melioribacteraceae bacterium]
MLELKRIHSVAELQEFRNEWIKIEKKYSFFQSWQWNYQWINTVLVNDDNSELDVWIIFNEGKIIAILPFFMKPIRFTPIKVLYFLSARMSYDYDVLLSEDIKEEDIDDLIRLLKNNLSFTSFLHLRHMNEDSKFTKRLIELNYAIPQCKRIKVLYDPLITDHTKRLHKHTRESIRMRTNRLFKQTKAELRVMRDGSLQSSFDELILLHNKRFNSRSKKTILAGNNLLFLKKVIEEIPDKFEIVELVSDSNVIASHLAIVEKENYYSINTGFDPVFAWYSPNKILLNAAITRAFNDLKLKYFDLGPGYESYKYSWNPSEFENYFCCLSGKSVFSKLSAFIYKTLFIVTIKKAIQK